MTSFYIVEHNFFAALLGFERRDRAYVERRAAALASIPDVWDHLPGLVLNHPPLHPAFAKLIGSALPVPTPRQATRLSRLDPRCKHKLENFHLEQTKRTNNPFVKAFAA